MLFYSSRLGRFIYLFSLLLYWVVHISGDVCSQFFVFSLKNVTMLNTILIVLLNYTTSTYNRISGIYVVFLYTLLFYNCLYLY